MVYSGFHMLSKDPRRRFTFGVTIEDTESRLWYFSRSFIVVSTPFNFIEVSSTQEEHDFDDTFPCRSPQ